VGRVEAICISERKGERKTPVAAARFITSCGIEGDAHAGPWHRQISLLDASDVEQASRAASIDLPPGAFAENLLISGLDLGAIGLGSQLRLGTGVVLSISQIGKHCHAPCRIQYLTGACIMPRRGLFAVVEEGGDAAPGVEIEVAHRVPREAIQAVVLTISDRCSRSESTDTAGPAIVSLLQDRLKAHVYATGVLPDEKDVISERLRHYCDGHSIDLVVTVGGTGFAARDVTPEAVRDVVDRLTPGLDDAMRAASLERSPRAMLSRAASGIRARTLVLSLPGSLRASTENLDVVLPALPHGLALLRGEVSDCGRPVSIRPAHG
jgi:molybdopterin adenylyltransferase